jgi:aminoglycoside 6-adenylyltransferase
MLELILSVAQNDERVRVVGMNGSRTNAKVATDRFQDYDIVYLVTDLAAFLATDWVDVYGRCVIMQKPDAMTLFPQASRESFAYLMLFEDGNRIDLTLMPLERLAAYCASDTLLTILLDKDARVGALPPPSDTGYWVKKPCAAHFDDCCNEFWWVSTYVAKGLCRDELLYATDHLNRCVRPELLRMLSWQVGVETGFSTSVGASYKHLRAYLAPVTWTKLLSTYRLDTAGRIAAALRACLSLFRESARLVASRLAFPYPDYDAKVSAYLESALPSDGS